MKTTVVRFFKRAFSVPEVPPVSDEAVKVQSELLASARAVVVVNTPASAQAAVDAARAIAEHVKAMVDLGLEFRRPISNYADGVKRFVDDYVAPLVTERKRLERCAMDFHEAEERRVEDENRKRQQEIDAVEAKRVEAERKAAELLAKASTAKQVAAAEKAQAKATAATEAVQAVATLAPAAVFRPGGTALRSVAKWEVVDVKVLHSTRPELFKLEIKPAAVNSTCKPLDGATLDNPDTMSVPGLKQWWERDMGVRRR